MVYNFRVKEGLEIGDPPRDVNGYLCSKFPRMCRPSTEGVEADESPQNKTLRQRTTNWRYNRYAQSQSGSELETEDVAESRAAICSTCPNNQSNREGCPPCVVENDRVLFMLRQGRSVSKPLGGCMITGQDNTTAAFLPPDMLTYARKYKDELPDFCWLPR